MATARAELAAHASATKSELADALHDRVRSHHRFLIGTLRKCAAAFDDLAGGQEIQARYHFRLLKACNGEMLQRRVRAAEDGSGSMARLLNYIGATTT